MEENRFAIKGAGVLGAMDYLGHRGWLDDAILALPPDHRNAFATDVLPALWYPLEPYQAFLDAAAESGAGAQRDAMFQIGRSVINYSLNTMYKVFRKSGALPWLLKHSPILWSLFFRGTQLSSVESGDGFGMARIAGDAPTTAHFCETIRGGISEALTIGGAREVQVGHDRCREHGHRECVYKATWKD